MTLARVSEVIHEWLGWCPNARLRVCHGAGEPDEFMNTPSERRSFIDRAEHWIGLFRNQILLMTILISVTGFWMFAGMLQGSYPLLFIVGMITGFLFSAYAGTWYWRIFNEVLAEGPVVLRNRFDAVSPYLSGISILVPFVILSLVFIGAVPGVNLAMINAIIAGICVVIFWGPLISTWKWESKTHRVLHFDGMILELERKEKYAIC